MFPTTTYQSRRDRLCKLLSGSSAGKVLLYGNDNAGMNYSGNTYHYRQDSTFLYFIGIDQPGLAAVVDPESGKTTVYGDELTMDDIVWTGEVPSIREQAAHAGIQDVRPRAEMKAALAGKAHYLPPYRGDHVVMLHELLGKSPAEVKAGASLDLIQAVVKIRSYKTEEEIVEIEKAVRITNDMHLAAMRTARPGVSESEVYAAMMEVVNRYDTHWSFPAIVTRNGQILHNHSHENLLRRGDLLLVDCGAESKMHYAGDMTRAFPVNATFSERQKAVYEVCLQSQLDAIATLKPGSSNRHAHLTASRTIAAGLKDLGIMKGDPDAAVEAGAHALFFPHGLGHMMGMDVHDMENVGEDHVGYDEEIKRSSQFGLAFLRLGRKLEKDFVITVEPGIYFIPQLIDTWRKEGTNAEFINFDEADKYKDFGGIRIEDDFLITADGSRLLGDPVPKTVAEVETYRSNHD